MYIYIDLHINIYIYIYLYIFDVATWSAQHVSVLFLYRHYVMSYLSHLSYPLQPYDTMLSLVQCYPWHNAILGTMLSFAQCHPWYNAILPCVVTLIVNHKNK